MGFSLQVEPPPLYEDETGALRVGQSRVLLELVIESFQDGATAEAIVQRYETLALADVYAVIAYYLKHRSEIETYLAGRDRQAQDVRRKIEHGLKDLTGIRERLSVRRGV